MHPEGLRKEADAFWGADREEALSLFLSHRADGGFVSGGQPPGLELSDTGATFTSSSCQFTTSWPQAPLWTVSAPSQPDNHFQVLFTHAEMCLDA